MSKLFDAVVNYCTRHRNEVFDAYMSKRKWSKETIEKWKIGYFQSNDLLSLKILAKQSRISEEELAVNGVLRKNKSIFFNRIVFPIWDVWGDLIAITGRTLNEEIKPKYYNTVFEKGKNLFGLNFSINEIIKTQRVYVFEGNADVITAHQFGIENSVCVMGTALSDDHLILLSRYAREIVLMFDNDIGGRKALASFNKKKLERKEVEIYRVQFDKVKDADEYLNKLGKDALIEHIEKSIKDRKEQNRLKSILQAS